VIVTAAGGTVAVGVDRLRGTSTVVVRPIAEVARASATIAGAALDAEGNPQLVLDPEGLVAEARRARAPAASRAMRHRILVVDDSLTTRMLEQSILESAGYDVDTAVSGELALDAGRARPYSLFLVDVEMPGIDGFTFIERVRADPSMRDTPAILVTSRSSPDDRQRGEAVGAQGYIVKSEFDQAELLAHIRRLVE
jgi:two-component system chemotaxis sensor kinase CheA